MIMGREDRDSAAIGSSSIALLQERFRQLQRAREQREVRELKLFFEKEKRTKPVKKSFEEGADKPVFLQESGDEDLLTLGLNFSRRNGGFQGIKKRPLWWGDKTSVSTRCKMENSDVDTSLHL